MTSITSVELNYLVFRYLQESGLTHSAFALGYEAGINKYPVDGNLVPYGALIKFVQKGLQYLEMEANLSNGDTDMDEDFSFISPLDLITKDVSELREIIKERKKNQPKEMDKILDRGHEGELTPVTEREKQKSGKEHEKDIESTQVTEKKKQDRAKEHEKDRDRIEKFKQREKPRDRIEREMIIDQENKANAEQGENAFSGGPEPMDISTNSTSQACEIPSSDVLILEGHTYEVCACAWSPAGSLIASGSGDSTARIWKVADRTNSCSLQNSPLDVLVLEHVKDNGSGRNKDVTTLDWNCDGSLLATGSYDGHARIWTPDGELRSTLSKHKGPIFSIKWNKKGDYILTGSCDNSAIVWDVQANDWKQQFQFHSGPTLDTDWRNDVSFATSSTDTKIHVCKIGEDRPIKTFSGHKSEVNSVKWDPTGSLLASCSDDTTAKIWSMKQDNYVYDLREHTKEIYTIRWSPAGPGTSNPDKQLVLASASFDSTVKIWDVELGRVQCSLNGHRDAVYSVAFSPNAEYLASGSMDRCIHIWSLKEGKIIKTYRGNGSIFEVCWNKEGDKIAACTNSNTVCVLDFRM